jgi:hypothetical protein
MDSKSGRGALEETECAEHECREHTVTQKRQKLALLAPSQGYGRGMDRRANGVTVPHQPWISLANRAR